MKRIWLLFLCIPIAAFSQNSQEQIDSLKVVLESVSGLEKVRTQYNLATLLITIDPELADSLSLDALKVSRGSDFAEGEVLASIVQATLSNLRGDLERSKQLLKESVALAAKQDFKDGLSKAHTALGSLYFRKGEYALATENHLLALKAAEELGSFDVQITNLMNIGLIKQRIGGMDEAFGFFERALAICEEHDFLFRSGQLYINLGVLEFSRQNVGLSIEYNQKAFEVFEGFGDFLQQAISLQNIGFAQAYLGNYQEADDYYDRAIDIRKEIGDRRGMAATLLNKARLRSEMSKPSEAIRLATEALEITEEIKNARLNVSLNLFLSQTLETLGRSADALDYYKRYILVKDSLSKLANETRIAELTSGFEFENQQQALQKSRDKLRLLESQRWVLILTILIGVALALIALTVFRARMARIKLEKRLTDEEKKSADLNREKLQKEVELQSIELKGYVEKLSQKNEIIQQFKTRLEEIDNDRKLGLGTKELTQMAVGVDGRSVISISLEEFRLKFSSVHQSFISKIIDSHGSLTQNEIDLCIFFKVNLTYKDIAQIQNISYEGVKKAIQRLYKKLGYKNAEGLRIYLLGI
ncbi:MAG: tetratricopeptide repeat protein [Roseivirga sp.]|nr:tetratricopeptide repeat protein [Roseivirga sp.]